MVMRTIKKNLKKFNLSCLSCLIILFSSLAFCQLSDTYGFDSSQQEKQFITILYEMRCPVCQNQNLADSNAPLAKDLRLVIYRRVQQGQSAEQIKDYLVSRYGEFISFMPRFSPINCFLWLSPFSLLLIMFFLVGCKIKQ